MTQLLGDVELVTKQELEAALEATVISENSIDDKVQAAKDSIAGDLATQKTLLESAINVVDSKVAAEVSARQDADTDLTSKIADEATLRETSDNALQTRVEREEQTRQTADNQIIELVSTAQTDINTLNTQAATLTTAINEVNAKVDAMPDVESMTFEDSVFCSRMSNLPFAQMIIENKDKTLAVGDIIGTVTARYFPRVPATFSFVTETTDDKYAYITARLNANGEITVINKTVLTTAFTGNINSTTIFYITKE